MPSSPPRICRTAPPIVPMRLQPLPEFKPFEQPVIAHDKVRYVGEPIAVVLASTRGDRPRTRWNLIALEIEDLAAGRRPADRRQATKASLFEEQGTNRSLTFDRHAGRCRCRLCDAPYVRARASPCQPPSRADDGAARPCWPTWDEAKGKLTIYGAAKVPFFNRRILSAQIGLPIEQIEMIENDVGGGFGVRGEFYPEDFLIPFAAQARQPPGEMDRGPPRKSDGDESRPRQRVRPRNRLHARRHHPRPSRRGPRRHGRLHPHQWRGRCAQRLAVHGRPVPRAACNIDSHLWMTNKTPVGTYRGPGRFEANFFRERMIDLAAKISASTASNSAARISITAKEQPYPIAHAAADYCHGPSIDSGEYVEALDRALKEFNWDEKAKLQGKLIDGKYHGLGVVSFIEGGAAGPKGNRADRGQDRQHVLRLSRHHVGRAGRRDHLRADRRRRSGNSGRECPADLSRLHRLCERGLRRVSFALDGDGRLGSCSMPPTTLWRPCAGGGQAARLRGYQMSRSTWTRSIGGGRSLPPSRRSRG